MVEYDCYMDCGLGAYPLFSRNQIEQLSSSRVLKYDKYVWWRIDELKVLDNVGVVESAEYFYFSLDFLEDTLLLYFFLV